MKRSEINAWTAALRSGDYKQGSGYLSGFPVCGDEFNFCCLGVLCQINNVPYEVLTTTSDEKHTSKIKSYIYKQSSCDALLPSTITEEKHLFSSGGEIRVNKEEFEKIIIFIEDKHPVFYNSIRERLLQTYEEWDENIAVGDDKCEDGKLRSPGDIALSFLNDEGATFGLIADIIDNFSWCIFSEIEEDVECDTSV